MINILIPLLGIVVGLYVILYGTTRTEANFNIYKEILNKNFEIEDKKGFLVVSKISFYVIGFLILISGFLVSAKVISDRSESLYFLLILIFQAIVRLFIRIKFCKKLIK